ncbi:MAG TPA: Nramp family divalent metal transporter [Bryobacteraceae bacterium]|nr:Nramp family divalent metal transporter [Bryobacteraceae bacterium]
MTSQSPTNGRLRRFLANLGPGLITGAADDDPSGISTYSVAGASLGYSILWTALFSFPLMAAVQLMCARLGMVTGRGLGAVIRKRYPRWVLWSACLLLIVANVFNIGADLGGMGDAMRMVTGLPAFLWTPFFAALITAMLVWASYNWIVRVFKWLTLVLFAYIVTAFLAHPHWSEVLHATFVPHIEWKGSYMSVLVGILGTTISPYLFFWQASQEVEQERDMGRTSVRQRQGATDEELSVATTDVGTGMFYSNLVMYFILLTAAATLHAHGVRNIETAQQAADALGPLAGKGAAWLFTIALVGTGILAVPVLAGSCAYAIAEAATWRRASLNERPWRAARFYIVIAAAMAIGLVLNFLRLNAVKMLFWSAVINGLLAPPLVVLVVLLTSDAKVMGKRTNSRGAKILGWICAAVMTAAAVAMLLP